MGRGRQKAKHTKVARELKYFSPETNYGALEKELSGSQESHSGEWPEYEDPYAQEPYVEEYGDEDDQDEQPVAEHRSA
ncbi:MAG: DUF3073 domain-containing protein [Microbacteriaceae bacterium]